MWQEERHDPYAPTAKAGSAEVCDRCGAVLHAGRWHWGAPPLADVVGGLCPACRRIRDRYPAGTLRLPEDFLAVREEVLAMIRNAEQTESDEHPLERIMSLEDDPDGGLVVTTTGLHLARAITHELERRFHRRARIRYPEEGSTVLVDWETSGAA